MSAATLTMLTLLTAATRSPAAMTGTASGSSTVKQALDAVVAHGRRGLVASSGTAPSPSATVRTSSATV